MKSLEQLRENERWRRFNESKWRHPVRTLMGGREFLPFRERNPITVGLISVAVLAVLTMFAFSLNSFTFLRGVYTIEADFADAAGLTPDNEVRVAGLKVGSVKSIELASAGGSKVRDRVRVAMEIASGTELGSMSEAEIKLKTILGSKFVEIRPKGNAPLIRDENIIPLERTRIPFELYQVTNQTVETVGAVDARVLNEALSALADLTDDPEGNLGRALEGLAKASEGLSERDADLEELIQAGGRILDTLGSRSEALGRIFDSGADLLGALAARRDALSTFVRGSDKLGRELSSLIRSTRSDLDPALRDLHAALEVVKKDIGPLEKAVEALGPAAKSFGRAFTQGNWGDIWLQTVLDLPLPPILPGGTATSSGSGVQSIIMSSTTGATS